MRFDSLKAGILVALVSLLLAACSSTSTQDTAMEDTTALPADEVATGTVSDRGVSGTDLASSGADTVFYFDFDKSILKPEARAALSIHAERLIAYPQKTRLEGHGDERGSREYNMALGERRANAVKEYLVLQGVNPAILEVISYGEERPQVMDSNEQAWALNRRVEMK